MARQSFFYLLLVLLAASLAGCGSTPPRPAPTLPPVAAPAPAETPSLPFPEPPARLSAEQGRNAAVHALGLVGTPYRYGGNTPESGFDCSGLIGHVYRHQAGLAPPRVVAELRHWGYDVPREQMRTGDLVVFSQGNRATHAGIYLGDGRFVHAPSTGGRVRLDSLGASYWARLQLAVRRP